MSDDLNSPGAAAPAPGDFVAPPDVPRRSSGRATGWLIATVVVLVLAVAGGLFTAWIVANMRAVPGPVAAASATPGPLASCSCSFAPTLAPSAPPSPVAVHTPTPAPTAEVTLPPFTYVVQPGDHLINIANLYGVSLQDLMALNEITNPNRLQVGQELLIPGYGHPPTPKPTKKPR